MSSSHLHFSGSYCPFFSGETKFSSVGEILEPLHSDYKADSQREACTKAALDESGCIMRV